VTLHSDSYVKTTYSVTVANNSSSSKTLTVTGRSYRPASSTTSAASVVIKVDLRSVNGGNYSVASGEGGLYMSNSSKIVGGDVFVNGQINLSNSAQIGLSTNPVNVSVADQACPVPPDATYPRICNSGEGGQPIQINNTSHIYGTVKANNQTDGTAMSSPGLVAGSVAPLALPTYDRSAQKAAVTSTITSAAASCSSGTVTWNANTKITGNVSISGKCSVTVMGDVWITGALSVANSGQMIVSDTLGSTIPHVMVDGAAGAVFNNSARLASNSSSTGFEILTFWSTAGCSPDCSSLSGTDLYNSRNTPTIALNNTSQGPQTSFYAYWTRVQVGNSGQLGALIGQSIQLLNTGTITFTTSTGLGPTSWVANGYRRSY
jgi:hypothetical protein